MKDIAKKLNFNYDQRQKIAFGQINGINIAIKRDKNSGAFNLCFAISDESVSNNLKTALQGRNHSIISISTVGSHTEISISASGSDEEISSNIASILNLASSYFAVDRQKNSCSICQSESGEQNPYLVGERVMFACNNCSRGINGKAIYENPENVLRGLLGSLLFALPLAILIVVVNALSDIGSRDYSNQAFFLATGFPLAGLTIFGYRKFSMTKEYLKSISFEWGDRNVKYTRMLSLKGLVCIFSVLCFICILMSVITYALIIDSVYSAGFFHSILMIPYALTERILFFDDYQMFLPLTLLGTLASAAFWLLLSHGQRGQSDGGSTI